ncbi:MAG: F0F1 ATP synthase subunit B [Thalassobaculales bacterium]
MLSTPEFWVLVAFVLFVAVAWRLAGKSLPALLDGRAEAIRRQIEEARSLREEAQTLLATYQRKQRDALQEADAILAQAKAEAERLRADAAAGLEASLKRREQAALEKIAQAEAKAVQDVREMAVDLAVAATRRLLAETVDDARAAALVDQAIAELPAKLH